MDPHTQLSTDDVVMHPTLGRGTVELDRGVTVIVRFESGLEECEKAVLTRGLQVLQSIAAGAWAPALETVTRFQAEAIVSVNDNWGVFSCSRIALLPHQLWVCHRVLRRWPARYLVADDVGLGKTIEAGLILLPLISKELTQRILILCPAGLVDQWEQRLRTMFDIRCTPYLSAADRPQGDYWNSNHQVIASLPTLRQDNNGRHERLLAAQPWDLLIVDEAHHLNEEEHGGATLGYALVKKLMDNGKVHSALFFTGTPHRGKPYNFWALLRLLRADLFDPRRSDAEQMAHLREVLIRNNKQSVTDMQGRKLFKPVQQHPRTYIYNEEEREFYRLMTEFITSGRAYASTLSKNEGKQVVLVLITMQKLASSSVAAIRRALKRRLARLTSEKAVLQKQLYEEKVRLASQSSLIAPEEEADLLDLQQRLDELALENTAESIRLLANEIPHLQTLVEAAEAVTAETKVQRVLEVVAKEFPDRPVLFFTEYKATQALLMSALIDAYGDDCVAFINGDDRVEDVIQSNGRPESMSMNRKTASDRFNAGCVRFLVSTEAGGEGIDLQRRCHTLIHVDLPWNPMRLHQRVGRVNRYGQGHAVDVVSMRNEETVEALIWDKLNAKLQHIMSALSSVMDEPEDLLQLVLGMSDKNLFTGLFSEAETISRERLSDWFDDKTHTFGGAGAIETVKALVGNAAKFDYQGLNEIPSLDLPDLQPFFDAILVSNGRRPMWKEGHLAFKTPDFWRTSPAVRPHYKGVVFSREQRNNEADVHVIGVGHAAFDNAIRQALHQTESLSAVEGLDHPLVVAKVFDRVTETPGAVRSRVFGVLIPSEDDAPSILADDELLALLNGLKLRPTESAASDVAGKSVGETLTRGMEFLTERLPTLALPFTVPDLRSLGMLWPASAKPLMGNTETIPTKR